MKLSSIATLILCCSAFAAGCGDAFEPGSATSSGTSAGSGTGGGGTGGGGDGGNGGMGQGGGGPLCKAGTPQGPILLWTHLDDEASVSNPEVGDGNDAQVVTNPSNNFVPAQNDNGIRIDAAGEHVRFRQVAGGKNQFDPLKGAIDFCYQPGYSHTDGEDHAIFGVNLPPGFFRIRKTGGGGANALLVSASAGNGALPVDTKVQANRYSFIPGTWYRITISWDYQMSNIGQQVHVYIDGDEMDVEGPPPGGIQLPTLNSSDYMYIGAVGPGEDPGWSASGVIDEFAIYGMPIHP